MKKVLCFLSVICFVALASFGARPFSYVFTISPNQSYLKKYDYAKSELCIDDTIFNFVYNKSRVYSARL